MSEKKFLDQNGLDYFWEKIKSKFISSFNSRTGAVMPQTGDYTADMVGAAPEGFGWGNVLCDISAASREETYEEFCAKVDAVLEKMPNKTAALVRAYPPQVYGKSGVTSSILYRTNFEYAMLFNVGSADTSLSGWRMYKDNGTWYPFEWVNSALQLGVEYLTTERYNGKPVYTKLVEFGALPNNTTKFVLASDEPIKIFYCAGAALAGSQYFTLPIMDEALIWCGGPKINIKTTTDYSEWSGYVIVKYTKK